MRTFVEPLENLSGFSDLLKTAKKEKGLYSITGCIDAQKPHMMYSCSNGKKHNIIVTFDEQKAKELYEEYRFFDPEVVYYPAKDVLFYQADIRGNVLTSERIRALQAIHENEKVTVINDYLDLSVRETCFYSFDNKNLLFSPNNLRPLFKTIDK